MSTTTRSCPSGQRHRQALAATICLVGLLCVLVYTGPGRELVRGTLGDVLVVPFLYFGCGVWGPRARRARLIGVGLLAAGIECLQLLQLTDADDPWLLQIVLGTTFDPLDLLTYAVGLGAAYVVERWTPRFG